MNIELTYTQDSTGWHTGATYRDKDGTPVASRFAGRWQLPEVVNHLQWARANDRNKEMVF